ncbi:hypothetical protein FACS18949_13490 [Clostridia bacterium]|nr:hypothetical protein FACS18949_13490 [Clostridia bacterium]
MGLLTATAIQGYTDYTIRTVSYARYRVGTTYYTVKQPEKSILSDGTVAIDILIDHTVPGNITINQIQLFDMAGNLFLQKTENVIREDVQEGIFYRVKINFTEQ